MPRGPRRTWPLAFPRLSVRAGTIRSTASIQKVKAVSARVFASDYLCLGPKASGVWFTMFDEHSHVSERAEFHPHYPVHISIDSGVYTGAVWLQIQPHPIGRGIIVTVFADYLSEGLTAEASAIQIRRQSERLCGIGWDARPRQYRPGRRQPNRHRPDGPRGVSEAGLKGKNGLESWCTTGRKVDGAPARRGTPQVGR